MDDNNSINQIEATQQQHQRQASEEEQQKLAEELTPSVPVKPEKPKPSYKCLVCGKS
jgi:hypothetical protein